MVSAKNVENVNCYETLAMRSEIKGRRFLNQAKTKDFRQTYLYKHRSQLQLRVLLDVGQFRITFNPILESFCAIFR